MALKKKITENNGITVSYHKISKIEVSVNNRVSILVESYLDESFRQYEKDCAKGVAEDERMYPYIHSEYFSMPYDENTELFAGNITKKLMSGLRNKKNTKMQLIFSEVTKNDNCKFYKQTRCACNRA